MRALRALGMDGAVTYAFLARLANIAGSTGTVLLIVRFLTPVEQGYYYTLLSFVSLQIVFELGFSFVVQQLAAHECIHLDLRGGDVRGSHIAHARLASALRLSLRWYSAAAAAMGLLLAPAGVYFFARHASTIAAHVAWRGPWLLAVAASMAGLWCMPYYAFIEGCGHVRAVAAMRLRQSITATALAWTAMALHHGLYAPALVIVGQTAVGLLFLASHRRLLMGLLRHLAREAAIDWRREVWPFQWRIAASSMCGYFTVQVFIPMIFALRGPIEAGQIGMSLSITGYMGTLALAWTSTKATPFGRLIARKEFHELDRLFGRALGRSIAVFAVIAVCAIAGIALLRGIAPRLAMRMMPASLFAVLVLGAAANHVTQNLAILLRSFKYEPFLGQSIAVATLTILLAAAMVPTLGASGATLSYLLATGAVGLPIAWTIFVRARRGYMADVVLSQPGHIARSIQEAAIAAQGEPR